MKRRLFLKTGSVGLGGMLAIPSVIYGCTTVRPISMQGPSKSVSLFTDGSRLFDSAIAELRTAGSGELASAEAEDVTLSGTGELDLFSLAEQVTNQQAAIPAELAEDFAESSADMLSAAGSLAESAPHLFPLDRRLQAELADDFALLKVVKASTLLASAAAVTPQPEQKVHAAKNMVASAEMVHKAVRRSAEAELIESTGELLAYSEEYVGSCEQFAAEPAFIEGVESFEFSVSQLANGDLVNGVANLLTSTDNIALSSGYYASGIQNLNAEADFFGGKEITAAEEFIPYAKELVQTSPKFLRAAKGDSAKFGAEKMILGSAELLQHSMHEVAELGIGGAMLDIGSDQFIGGEITFNAAEEYTAESNIYLQAAEKFDSRGAAEAEAEFIHETTESMFPASENFFAGAEALQTIKQTAGVETLMPAAQEVFIGAKQLQSEADNRKAEKGAEAMVIGAEKVIIGAEQSSQQPAKHLELGAELIEIGTNTMMAGAALFVKGYS